MPQGCLMAALRMSFGVKKHRNPTVMLANSQTTELSKPQNKKATFSFLLLPISQISILNSMLCLAT